MRYLITGGAGFIGSHLSEDLLASGHRVHVLDDLSTGAIDNIRHLKDDSRFSYTIESAASRATIAELVDEADIVFHLAAAVGVELIVDSPVRTIETNVHCTEIVLEAANKKKKPVFITSTSEVYGKGNDLPFREDGVFVAWARLRQAGGRTHAPRRSMNTSPSPTGRSAVCRSSSGASSTRSDRGRPGATAWSSLPLSAGARREPNHRARRRAAAPLLLPRQGRRPGDGRPHGQRAGGGGGRQHREHLRDHDSRSRRAGAPGVRIRVQFRLIPYEEAYETGFEDMRRRIPDISKIGDLLDWRATRTLDQILQDVIESQRAPAALPQSA